MAPLHAELIAGAYPANRDSTIVLRDGSTLAVRPIKPEDEAGLAHFFSSLSMESRILRFFAPVANADATAKGLVQKHTHVLPTDLYGWSGLSRPSTSPSR